ncbi:ABC transporter substrate-binding protein [Aestuariispira ectoiniformans]|uniref:ABC transporter substrate-binding protein n=1 Tax=Aestuariispira ectoiniformans TaxID=2775080 RepID=UPI00223B9882|nr:ABC transporter substrate-binding protein [Aestuariispira ectoiniformans]
MRRIIAGALIGAALLAGQTQTVLADTPKNALVMAYSIDDMITLDPGEMFEFTGMEYNANTYDRLVGFDLDDVSKIKGELAESWSVSEDGKTLTFKIRDGVKFASGNPVTADDAAFSFRRVIKMDKSPAFILGQFGFRADNVDDRIRATDDHTLVMELDKPYAPTFVLYCLTAGVGAIVDKQVVMDHAENGDFGNKWLRTHYAGSGAFSLKSWKPNQSLSLVANEDYWQGAPEMKRVLIRHVKEAASQQLLLEKGDIDIARNLEADQLAAVSKNPEIKLQRAPKGAVWYLGLSQKNEYLSKPEVRQALKYLVDYKGIASTILNGRGTVHQAFLPKGFMGALEDNPFSLDVAKAKGLLAKAGLEDGFKVTMDTRNTTLTTQMAQSIQSTFAQAGIDLEIIPGDGKQTLTKYRARKHDIYIGRWGPDYQDPHTNADTFASNPDNSDDARAKPLAWRNSWDIPEMTKKTQANVLEKDAAKRAEVYREIQKEHQQVSPFVIMFQDIEVASLRKDVNNFVLGPSFDTNFYRFVTKSDAN